MQLTLCLLDVTYVSEPMENMLRHLHIWCVKA